MSAAQTPTTETTTEQINARVEKRLAELTKQRAARKEPDDLPGSLSARERNAYLVETAALDAQITAIRTAAAAAASFPTLDLDIKWHEFLKTSYQTLGDELMTFEMPVRGEAKQRSDALAWSIKFIDRGLSIAPAWMPIMDLSRTRIGELMRAAGYEVQGEGLRGPRGWRGSLPEVEARVKKQSAEREKAIAKLNALLLTDEERAKQDAEVERHRAALRTMRLQADATGLKLIAFTKDDEPLPVEKMTPAQRAAFEWFEPAACPPRERVASSTKEGFS